ncbi:hypothetical protein [Tardiphaga sp.]|jgi:hypothetical protein|uniref:hypothetical protein n=1 Tax=Tardiphaga sp. TaxID=1926292 RepID=UPI0037DA0E88
MRMENVLSSWNGPDSLIVENFDKNVRFNMEMALDKACQSLPPALNNHDFRRMIAVKIAEQVKGGPCSTETINLAAAKAVEDLRQQHSR